MLYLEGEKANVYMESDLLCRSFGQSVDFRYQKEEASWNCFVGRSSIGYILPDISKSSPAGIKSFGNIGGDFFFRNQQGDERGFRIWRQYFSINSWNLSGILESALSFNDSIYACSRVFYDCTGEERFSQKNDNTIRPISGNCICTYTCSRCLKDKMRKERWKEKEFRGVITVEMSYLLPLVLLVFLMVIYAIFYYHDKNILIGAASETSVLGAQLERKPDTENADLTEVFQERIQGKLIFFSGAQAAVNTTEKWVEIDVSARKGRMQLRIIQRAPCLEPEKKIRKKRMAEKAVGL